VKKIACAMLWMMLSVVLFPLDPRTQGTISGEGAITGADTIAAVSAPSWDKGINFRASSGYVTDGANFTYSLGVAHPETRNGVTFGWEISGVPVANRSTSYDVRLAGIAYESNDGSHQRAFRVDLPTAGTYAIRLALGDATSGQGYQYAQFRDDTTAFATIADTDGTAAANFDDATGTGYSAAAWPGSNTAITHTFSSNCSTGDTTKPCLWVAIGSPDAQSGSSTIASIEVIQQ
jgi:hypothetical protein